MSLSPLFTTIFFSHSALPGLRKPYVTRTKDVFGTIEGWCFDSDLWWYGATYADDTTIREKTCIESGTTYRRTSNMIYKQYIYIYVYTDSDIHSNIMSDFEIILAQQPSTCSTFWPLLTSFQVLECT